MKISSFLLQLELEVCQASRVLRVFCKGKGHSFTAVERNGLFPYLQDGWLYGKMQDTVCSEPSPCSSTCGWTSPSAHDSCWGRLPRGAPGWWLWLAAGRSGLAVCRCCKVKAL